MDAMIVRAGICLSHAAAVVCKCNSEGMISGQIQVSRERCNHPSAVHITRPSATCSIDMDRNAGW